MQRAFLLVLLALTTAACEDAPPDPELGNGALHEGNFVYSCTSAADAFCADQPPTLMPSGIAQGADFGLRFDQGTTTLEVDPSFFDLSPDGALHAKRAGWAAVLAHAPSGDVVDFVNLHVELVASLAIRGVDGGTVLATGDRRAVRGEPLDADGKVLAGTLAFDWETSNSNVIQIEVDVLDRTHGGATLKAAGPGVALIRAVSGSTLASVTIQVGGA